MVAALLAHLFVGGPSGIGSGAAHATCNSLDNTINVMYGLLLYVFGVAIKSLASDVSVITSNFGGLSSVNSSIVAVLNFGLTGGPTSGSRPFNRNEVRCVSTFVITVLVLLINNRLVGASIATLVNNAPVPACSAISVVILTISIIFGI